MRVLISGGGIAGLTLAILLKQQGIEPTVVEREPGLGATGYMMDFFGTGWDVAERMGLTGALRVVRYPIERMEFVASDGKPYCTAPIERMRAALDHKYVYLRWSDLEKILFDRACTAGVKVHFGASIESLNDDGTCVRARFADQTAAEFDLVVGADGVHSNVRALAFGPEQQFARYLGYYAAAFHFERKGYGLGHAFKLYEETDRTVWLHPLDAERGDATLVFRHTDAGHVAREERAPLLRAQFAGAGWVTQKLLRELDEAQHIYLDSLTQIDMPEWHRGRVVLVGDACGCLLDTGARARAPRRSPYGVCGLSGLPEAACCDEAARCRSLRGMACALGRLVEVRAAPRDPPDVQRPLAAARHEVLRHREYPAKRLSAVPFPALMLYIS